LRIAFAATMAWLNLLNSKEEAYFNRQLKNKIAFAATMAWLSLLSTAFASIHSKAPSPPLKHLILT